MLWPCRNARQQHVSEKVGLPRSGSSITQQIDSRVLTSDDHVVRVGVAEVHEEHDDSGEVHAGSEDSDCD